jgi:hypothetical protein
MALKTKQKKKEVVIEEVVEEPSVIKDKVWTRFIDDEGKYAWRME